MRRGTTEVAVKVLNCRVDDDSIEAIQQEVAMLQKVSHDGNIVQFYGTCLSRDGKDGTAMLCMECMEARLINSGSPISLKSLLRLATMYSE